MNPKDLPVVGTVFRLGAQDRVLDSFLLLGPIVILSFVVLGRNAFTISVTGAYLLSFIGYVLYKGIR
ncbi:hypothetical protein [Halorussus ruber]|uniref:hypothetical protein n=1 Tax=Halorussus ruber TaxID=1126238 RepID=UPI001091CD30|nr:hypothetical protein [Halorussus ruber]